jgi:hypothetical protein
MNVLLFSPDTFDYHHKIIKTLEENGYTVDWINHIIVKNNFDRARFRLFPKISSRLIEKQLVSKIDWNKKYDKIVVIKGEGVSCSVIEMMKSTFIGADFIYYTWDSLSNVNGALDKLKYFDSIKSFDRVDCHKYKKLQYFPLFYSQDYTHKEQYSDSDLSFGAIFIGTLHSNRFEKILNISKAIEKELKKPSFIFFFYHSKVFFYILRLFKKEFRSIPINKVSFKKLSAKEIAQKMSESSVVIDYGHPDQSGLTMRTFEAFGMNKKLLTNNKLVREDSFYNPNNIFIVDEDEDEDEGEGENIGRFISGKFIKVDRETYEYHSLNMWVERLLKC